MLSYERLSNRIIAATIVVAVTMSSQVQAHFIWLAPQQSGDVVQVYFGEDASSADPEYLKYIDGMQAWMLSENGQLKQLEPQRTEEEMSLQLGEKQVSGLILASHDLGVMDRGDSKFRLKYFAKTGPAPGAEIWSSKKSSEVLKLDVIPQHSEAGTLLTVLFNGEAISGAESTVSGPGLDHYEEKTGESGTVVIPTHKSGLYSIRVKHVEAIPGELEGKEYPETRYYTTLTLRVQSDSSQLPERNLQSLKQPVTSFGGAILNGYLYIYGGHTGGAHSYGYDAQAHHLQKLDLKTGEWSTIVQGPRLQGLALVAAGDKLYRIGGFTAKNKEGDDHDLWSQDSVAAIDPADGKWIEMPSLPEPRSSFDAAVLDGKIYVAGGWAMAGEAENIWHQTAWVLDTQAIDQGWQELPTPPFQRRALAMAAYNGKIYAIGGMQSDGGPTRQVDVYDPQTKTWSSGPEILGEDGMTGFGSSAFATGGRLYVSTIKGDLQRLSQDDSTWEMVKKTPTPRFFHRMLPYDQENLLVVGGASMEIGKFDEVEVISVE